MKSQYLFIVFGLAFLPFATPVLAEELTGVYHKAVGMNPAYLEIDGSSLTPKIEVYEQSFKNVLDGQRIWVDGEIKTHLRGYPVKAWQQQLPHWGIVLVAKEWKPITQPFECPKKASQSNVPSGSADPAASKPNAVDAEGLHEANRISGIVAPVSVTQTGTAGDGGSKMVDIRDSGGHIHSFVVDFGLGSKTRGAVFCYKEFVGKHENRLTIKELTDLELLLSEWLKDPRNRSSQHRRGVIDFYGSLQKELKKTGT